MIVTLVKESIQNISFGLQCIPSTLLAHVQVDHINEKKKDNSAKNLRMMTYDCNHKLHPYRKKEKEIYIISKYKLLQDGWNGINLMIFLMMSKSK